MLFNGVECVLDMGDVVNSMKDNTMCVDYIVNRTHTTDRNSQGSGVYMEKKDLLPDMWWVLPLSRIILRNVDRRGKHGIVLLTRATILARGHRLE